MELDTIDAIQSGNRAKAIDAMKAILGDKALDVVDAQRQAIAQQMFGDAIGADPAEEPTDEVETDEVETTADAETPEAPEPVVEPSSFEPSPEVEDTVAKAAAAISGQQQDEVTPDEPTDETDQGTD